MTKISRRDFLKISSGSLTFGVMPSTLAAATTRIGMIGVGKHGLRLLNQLMELPQLQINGICDVSQSALDRASEIVPKVPLLTQDYRELLSRDELQAVVIATPDFSHTPLALAALEAGKDVYLETPLTRTIQEFDHLLQTAQANGRIVYTGDTVDAHPAYIAAAQLIQTGLLGKISRVHIVVNLPPHELSQAVDETQMNWEQFLLYLPSRPFDAALLTRWQNQRECSDGAAIAQLLQALRVVHRVMQVTQPTSITAQGGVYVWRDGRDNPDTFYALLDYAEDFVISFSLYPGSKKQDVFAFYGTKGTLDLLNWQIITTDAVETPVSDAIAHHTSEQLSRAARHYIPQPADFVGWLNVMQQRHLSSAVVEQWSQAIHLSRMIAGAIHPK